MEDKTRRKSSRTERQSSRTDVAADHRSGSNGQPTDRRHRSHRSESSSADVDGVVEDGSSMRKRSGSSTSGSQRRLKSQQSVQSGSGSDTAEPVNSGAEGEQTAAGNPLKSIWKRAVKKLTKLREKAADEPLTNETSTSGEVDPVYSFLKLNAGARLGSTVIPPEDHLCCPAADYRTTAGLDPANVSYSNSDDPAKCVCPCHLPQRLEGYHENWLKAFGAKKS